MVFKYKFKGFETVVDKGTAEKKTKTGDEKSKQATPVTSKINSNCLLLVEWEEDKLPAIEGILIRDWKEDKEKLVCLNSGGIDRCFYSEAGKSESRNKSGSKKMYDGFWGCDDQNNNFYYMASTGKAGIIKLEGRSIGFCKSSKGTFSCKRVRPNNITVDEYGQIALRFDPKQTKMLADNTIDTLDDAVDFLTAPLIEKGVKFVSPVANDDNAYIPVDFEKQLYIDVNVLANDTDPNGYDFIFSRIVSQPELGTVEINSDSSLRYSVSSWDGFESDSFKYEIINSKGGISIATVYVGYNPPVTVDDSAFTTINNPVSIDVLANDSDVYGSSLNITQVSEPEHGSAVIESNVIIYTPDADYVGLDSFTCAVANKYGAVATETVTVYVDNPQAVEDSVYIKVNESVKINVLENDTDPCGLTLSISSYTEPDYGSLQLSDENFFYIPNTDFSGSDFFDYTISNGYGATATATVKISVGNGPLPMNDTAYTSKGTAVSINILANDTDSLGLDFSITNISSPSNGSVEESDNVVTYTPSSDFTGIDTFTYTITDTLDLSASATVTIYVDEVTAANDSVSVRKNQSVEIDVLANDTDACGLSLLVYTPYTPTHGIISLSNNTFTYTPETDFTGSDSFLYIASNGHGVTDKATVLIEVTETPSPTDWTVDGVTEGENFGYTVASAGDVNGDGFDDALVAASFWGGIGYVCLYNGSDTGLETTASWKYECDQSGAFPGFVATAGDVNGDGYADVIIGIPLYNGGEQEEGRVVIFYGSANGLSSSPDWSMESDNANSRYGRAIATAGDVNGDGYDDVIIGAPWHNNYSGKVYLYLGSASGLSTSAAWTKENGVDESQFGFSVAGGDINNDGFSDVVIGAKGYTNGEDEDAEGAAYIFTGSADGLTSDPLWTTESNVKGAEYGYSVANAGDINGDGYNDILVGAWVYGRTLASQGAVYVYYSSSSGPATSPDVKIEGDGEGSLMGISVRAAGDVNKDGYSDIILSAPAYTGYKGKVYLYHGSADGLGSSPSWTLIGDAYGDLGYGLSSGDFNNDEYSDIIISAPYYNDDKGRVYIYYGYFDGL